MLNRVFFILFLIYSNHANAFERFKLKHKRLSYEEILSNQQSKRFYQRSMPFDDVTIEVAVGSTEQRMQLRIETGSSQTWLVGLGYPGHATNRYDPNNSTLSRRIKDNIQGRTGLSTISGQQFIDKLYFVITFKQTNWMNSEPTNNPDLDFDGILGLYWTAIDDPSKPNENSSLVLNWLGHFANKYKMFSIWFELETFPNKPIQQLVDMTYGGVDSTWKCSQDFKFFDLHFIDSSSPLAFNVNGFHFDDFTSRKQAKGLLDTGVSVIYFPTNIVNVLVRKLDAEFDERIQLYVVDCTKAATLKDWIFTIEDKDYFLNSTQYIIDIQAPSNKCVAAFDVSYYTKIDFIFGLPMLRPYCSGYDLAQNKVGLATAIHGSLS